MTFYFVFFFYFVLSQDWASISATERRSSKDSSSEEKEQNLRSLLQTYSLGESSSSENGIPFCSIVQPHSRYTFEEVLTNVPGREATSNAFHCCQLCEATPQCQAWNRERVTGECILGYNDNGRLQGAPDIQFDAGFIQSRIESFVMGSIREQAVVVPCRIEDGVRYLGENLVGEGELRDAIDCCNVCRFSSDCQSWYHSNATSRCVLNGDLPSAVLSSTIYTGGTL